jgi:hypothetical protein
MARPPHGVRAQQVRDHLPEPHVGRHRPRRVRQEPRDVVQMRDGAGGGDGDAGRQDGNVI